MVDNGESGRQPSKPFNEESSFHFEPHTEETPLKRRRIEAGVSSRSLLDVAPMPPEAQILIYLQGKPASEPTALVDETQWQTLPSWLAMKEGRGKQMLCWKGHPLVPADALSWSSCYICMLKPIPCGSQILWCDTCHNWCVCPQCAALPRMPLLSDDLLFRGCDDPCLIEWGTCKRSAHGTVIICPGGNYEFLCSSEALPAAMWLARHGIYAVVLRYRLLPKYTNDDMLDDLSAAMAHIRKTRKGPIVGMGFSAGAHLVATFSIREAYESEGPCSFSGQVLIYPAIDASDWLEWSTCGFFNKEECFPRANSLAARQNALLGGSGFKAPPSFLISSTGDRTCPPEDHGDVYTRALVAAKVPHVHIRRDLGDHGFALEGDWTQECIGWLKLVGLGFGSDDDSNI